MDAALTGHDATEAMQLVAKLGAVNARFDGRRVLAAVKTKAGRLLLAGAIRNAVRRVGEMGAKPRPRSVRRSRSGRTGHASRSPGRSSPRLDRRGRSAAFTRSERGVC